MFFLSDRQRLLIILAVIVGLGVLFRYWYQNEKAQAEKVQLAAKQAAQRAAVAEHQAREQKRLQDAQESQQREERRLEEEKREQLRDTLHNAVNDPFSMRLTNVRYVQGNGGNALCGDISAKMPNGKFFPVRPFAVTEELLEKATSKVIGVNRAGDPPDSNVLYFLTAAGCR